MTKQAANRFAVDTSLDLLNAQIEFWGTAIQAAGGGGGFLGSF